jgi:hypothetical protein
VTTPAAGHRVERAALPVDDAGQVRRRQRERGQRTHGVTGPGLAQLRRSGLPLLGLGVERHAVGTRG